ncbi:MAG: hypothetical protein ACE5JB_05795 [bacterium]
MDRFIEFKQEVNIEQLEKALSKNNPGIIILRRSKLTGMIKVRTPVNISKRDIKRAFHPYNIKKIYDDFPVKGL